MKNKALPGNLQRIMSKFRIMNINQIMKTFRENKYKWLHSVMKKSPANTQTQSIILLVRLQLDKA